MRRVCSEFEGESSDESSGSEQTRFERILQLMHQVGVIRRVERGSLRHTAISLVQFIEYRVCVCCVHSQSGADPLPSVTTVGAATN